MRRRAICSTLGDLGKNLIPAYLSFTVFRAAITVMEPGEAPALEDARFLLCAAPAFLGRWSWTTCLSGSLRCSSFGVIWYRLSLQSPWRAITHF